MKSDSNRLIGIDAAVIAVVSLAICLAADRLLLMTLLLPGIVLIRIALVAFIARSEQVNLKTELLFLAVCIALGAFNDWNSVCRKQIYAYTVPHYFAWSSIPVWMLLYWGMILRFIARFSRWQKLRPPATVSDRVGIGRFRIENGAIKVVVQLAIVLTTRQFIYRFYLDPIWSWVPFLSGLVVYMLLFETSRHDLKLLGVVLIAGPLVEILYIQVGHLHHYHLGWIGGTPLWIVVWWLLIVLIWKDLTFRMLKRLRVLPPA